MLTEKERKNTIKSIIITDDQYLVTAMRYYFRNITHFKSSDMINYITGKENENYIVLVDDRCENIKILKNRNISRRNDFLISLITSGNEKKEAPYHYESIIELSASTTCVFNTIEKKLETYSKTKTSSLPRKNTLTNTETTILKLLCMRKKPKEIAKIKNLSLPSAYRYVSNIVKKYDYRNFSFLYDELLKKQDIS